MSETYYQKNLELINEFENLYLELNTVCSKISKDQNLINYRKVQRLRSKVDRLINKKLRYRSI